MLRVCLCLPRHPQLKSHNRHVQIICKTFALTHQHFLCSAGQKFRSFRGCSLQALWKYGEQQTPLCYISWWNIILLLTGAWIKPDYWTKFTFCICEFLIIDVFMLNLLILKQIRQIHHGENSSLSLKTTKIKYSKRVHSKWENNEDIASEGVDRKAVLLDKTNFKIF